MRVALMMFSLLLSACQLSGKSADFDPARNYAGYQSWQWHAPAFSYAGDAAQNDLLEQRIAHTLTEQLAAKGLTHAQTQADLKVHVRIEHKVYEDSYTTQIGSHFGGLGLYETRTQQYPVQILTVDLLDGRDGRLIWRNQHEAFYDAYAHPNQRNQSIAQSLTRILQQYPPH